MTFATSMVVISYPNEHCLSRKAVSNLSKSKERTDQYIKTLVMEAHSEHSRVVLP